MRGQKMKSAEGEEWWLEGLRIAEWYSFELMLDSYFPPPWNRALDQWRPYSNLDWRRALVVFNRIFALGFERQVARALSTNFKKPLSIESICELAVVVDRAEKLFHKVATTQSERKRRAKVISQAAKILAEELHNPACQSDIRMARYLLAKEEEGPSRYPAMSPARFEDLAAIAEKMVDLPKVVASPGTPNAHKLYFLRELTDYLVDTYGRPMRSLVLALGGVYFDVSDMTTNDLAQYAKVNKQRRHGQLFSPYNFR